MALLGACCERGMAPAVGLEPTTKRLTAALFVRDSDRGHSPGDSPGGRMTLAGISGSDSNTLDDGPTTADSSRGAVAIHGGIRPVRESLVRDHFAHWMGGRVEVRVPFGRVDVVTETHVVEVEPVATWREGGRQALAYCAQLRLTPALAIFGDCPAALLDVICAAANEVDMDVFVLDGGEWWHIDYVEEAKMPTDDEVARRRPPDPAPVPSPEAVAYMKAMDCLFGGQP